jgi:hypothetical protein
VSLPFVATGFEVLSVCLCLPLSNECLCQQIKVDVPIVVVLVFLRLGSFEIAAFVSFVSSIMYVFWDQEFLGNGQGSCIGDVKASARQEV